MPTLEALKKQLESIEELGEISETLEQIAARNITKTRKVILAKRAFFDETWKVYRVLKQMVPYAPDIKNKDLVVIITLNRGLFGSLLNRVIKVGDELYKKHKADLLITGTKGQGYFADKDERTIHFFNIPNIIDYQSIEPIKNILAQYSSVHVVFPRYYSVSKQEVEVVSIEVKPSDEDKKKIEHFIPPKRFQIEPDVKSVLNYFNKAIMGILIFNFFNEASLAYNTAQMVAMRNAHENTDKEKKRMTFRYHKKRREIVDIKLRDIYKMVPNE